MSEMSLTIDLRPMKIGSEIIYVDDFERVRIVAYQLREYYRPSWRSTSGGDGKSKSSRSNPARSSTVRSPLAEPGEWRRGL
jgi:hypothetical protein